MTDIQKAFLISCMDKLAKKKMTYILHHSNER